ncbi:hypothetical protein EVA_06165 [gut metagenome]|uniref:Uncharacterized protein n=1 Tax=gut metagenome TaxID=749906 RepID=J9GY46_9ZZZZ
MALFAVIKFCIDLIRKYHNIGVLQYFSNLFQMLPLHHCTSGITGEWQHQQLGFGTDGRF